MTTSHPIHPSPEFPVFRPAGFLALAAFAVLLGATHLGAGESGMSLGPALILVRDAPPGRAFSLNEAAKTTFHVINNSQTEGTFDLACTIPTTSGLKDHELGYEAPPDASWFSITTTQVKLKPGEKADFDLRFNIPDRPECYGRHWMLYIDASPAGKAGIGTSLRLRARVMLETKLVAESLPKRGAIALNPGTVTMVPDGKQWRGTARMRNNSDRAATYDLLRLDQAQPERDKRARYFDRPEMVEHQAWGIPETASVTLIPGEERDIGFIATPTQFPAGGKNVEEVMIIVRRADANADSRMIRELMGKPYDQAGMLRLSYPPPSVLPDKNPPASPTEEGNKKP